MDGGRRETMYQTIQVEGSRFVKDRMNDDHLSTTTCQCLDVFLVLARTGVCSAFAAEVGSLEISHVDSMTVM